MKYHLIVITHGDGETLEATLDSFHEMVTPSPFEMTLIQDGGARMPRVGLWPWTIVSLGTRQQGFCAVMREAMVEALAGDSPHIFLLEHDFEFLRPIDLEPVAEVLDAVPMLAQMSFMRGPVNVEEEAAGGVIGKHGRENFAEMGRWLEHRVYWTTNPSLFPQSIAGYPWPPAPECEGHFGLSLWPDGWTSGIWGLGEEWVRHTGVRSGFGY